MRIPSGVVDQVIFFVAVDATDFTTRETGLATWTVYRARDTAAATAYTTPTITELSAANMPGVYKLLLDEDMTIGSGNDSEEMVFHITHTGMAPVTRTIELYRREVTSGETIGVASGAVSNVTTAATATAVTTVNGLAANVITATSIATDAITAAKIAADAIGASELAADAVTEIAGGVWNEDATAHQTTGTFGQAIGDPVADTNTIYKAVVTDGTAATVGLDLVTVLGRLPTTLVSGRIDASVGAMAAGTVTAAAIATDAVDADALAANAVDEIFDEVVMGSTTFRMMLRGFAAALLGKASGLGTTTAVYRNIADTMPVITATVDVDGNRTAVTLDLDDTP